MYMGPAPHVDGDPFWGLARSRRPGASPCRSPAASSRVRHPDRPRASRGI